MRAVMLVFLAGAGFADSSSGSDLFVKLYNDAGLERGELRKAQDEAGWLLKSAGVRLIWVSCPVVTVTTAACAAPSGAAELHILKAPLTGDSGPDALGLAMPMVGSHGRAAAFVSRVREVTESNPGIISLAHLLGHVMAHEVGHLLLQSHAHSGEGVMRADYGRPDLKKAAQRQLTFTPADASAIQGRLMEEAR